MKFSPVQLLETTLLKIAIEQNSVNPLANIGEVEARKFEFEHFSTIKKQERAPSEAGGNAIDGQKFVVALGIRTNEESLKQFPYSFEVLVTGEILIGKVNGWSDEERDDRAAQYGFTMLYGVIREAIANATGRMKWGSYIIPTVSFMDAKYPRPEGAAAAAQTSE